MEFLLLGLFLLALTVFVVYVVQLSNRKIRNQFTLLAEDTGFLLTKGKIKNNWFYGKILMLTGQLQGFESRIYHKVVSSNNSSTTYAVLEVQLPFVKDLNLVISKENILTNALKGVLGDGFVTRDDAFDDSFKVRTNQSLMVKQLLMEEAFRNLFIEQKDVLKGYFKIKNGLLKYEEVLTIKEDNKREKFLKIINFTQQLITALGQQYDLKIPIEELSKIAIKEQAKVKRTALKESFTKMKNKD